MAAKQLPIMPRAGPRPNAMNAASQSPSRSAAPPEEEYIVISSSSSSSGSDSDGHSDSSESEEEVQLEPHKRKPIELQRPLEDPSPTPEPNLFLSPPVQSSRPFDQPPAQNPQNASRADDEMNFPAWNEFIMDNNLNNFDAIDDFEPFQLNLERTGLAAFYQEENRQLMAPQRDEDNPPVALSPRAIERPPNAIDAKATCINMVLMVFPDICDEHVSNLYDTVSQDADSLVAHILENMEKGKPYAKGKATKKTLKRKREVDEDEEAIIKYAAGDRPANLSPDIQRYM